MILLIVTSCLIASSLHAIPLTWHFIGTTDSSSTYNGGSIEGLSFDLRISLDTNLLGVKQEGLSDVQFAGPFQGEVKVGTLPVLPLDRFENVLYFIFVPPHSLGVQGGEFDQTFGRFFINFPSSISDDILHLNPISPVAPNQQSSSLIAGGPNELVLSGSVRLFSATTTTVPDGGSTVSLLGCGLLGLAALRRKLGC